MLETPTPTATCANHKKRGRVAGCGVCGSSLCIDCIVHTAVGVKCRKCTGGAAATAPSAAKSAKVSKATTAKARKKWAVPVAAFGALLMIVGGLAVLTRGGGDSTDATAADPNSATDHSPVAGNGAFAERTADFRGGGGMKVGATLTVPGNLGDKTAPGVVIVPGGGAQDRNGSIQIGTQLPDPLYQDLAETFAQAGLVSMRYDRRGSPSLALGNNNPLRWEDLIADAKGALDFLSERRETQGRPIIVVGYDQGGFIAMKLAQTEPRVKGAVLLSTPGRPVWEVVAFDYQRSIPDPAKAQEVADGVRAGAAELARTGVLPNTAGVPDELRNVFNADLPYLAPLFAFDPVAEAGKVKVPTLLVRGGNDGSILPRDIENLSGVLATHDTLVSPAGSNTLSLPPGAEGRFHNPARHGTTRDGDATFAIAEWIKGSVK
ncbi:MAG: alpha/beta hydrolase [Acidimicrobiales bacterium]